MTFVLKLDLDIVKMSHHTKNKVSMSRHSKVIACTETHRQYENITFLHMRVVTRVEDWPVIYSVALTLFTWNISGAH